MVTLTSGSIMHKKVYNKKYTLPDSNNQPHNVLETSMFIPKRFPMNEWGRVLVLWPFMEFMIMI